MLNAAARGDGPPVTAADKGNIIKANQRICKEKKKCPAKMTLLLSVSSNLKKY
jgi:hypothetical protein